MDKKLVSDIEKELSKNDGLVIEGNVVMMSLDVYENSPHVDRIAIEKGIADIEADNAVPLADAFEAVEEKLRSQYGS